MMVSKVGVMMRGDARHSEKDFSRMFTAIAKWAGSHGPPLVSLSMSSFMGASSRSSMRRLPCRNRGG